MNMQTSGSIRLYAERANASPIILLSSYYYRNAVTRRVALPCFGTTDRFKDRAIRIALIGEADPARVER